jgi:hypothetical protein
MLGTAARCRRCEQALCLEHVPMAGECCMSCEQTYQHELGELGLKRWWWLGFALVWPLLPLALGPVQGAWRLRMWAWGALPTGLAMVEAATMTFVLALGVGHAAVALRRRRYRARFVSEHHLAPGHPRLNTPLNTQLAMPSSRR